MSLNLLGIEIINDEKKDNTFLPIDYVQADSTINYEQTLPAGGTATSYMLNTVSALSQDAVSSEENKLITQYRELLQIPEVDLCVEEIVQEAIIFPGQGEPAIRLDTSNLDEKKYSKKIKDEMVEEFETIYDMLLFARKGHDIFKRWLVDGRINYCKVVDPDSLDDGIQALTYIDPRKIKKVKETNRTVDNDGRLRIASQKEYFLYNENGVQNSVARNNVGAGVPKSHMMGAAYTGMGHSQTEAISIITKDSIAYAPSGILDASGQLVIGYLHKALKAANNLGMMEDAMLVYKLSRAPERRVFYIDTGNLTKAKAEQYVKNIADKHRSKSVYDSKTGEIRNDKKFVALTEDYWLPRGGGSKGTEISTLPGGQNGDTEETEYFRNKLFDALGVPKERFEPQPSMFSAGTQITRDEVRFSRLISRLRTNFNTLFEDILGTQLILRNIISPEEWDDIRNQMSFVYAEDNYFKEALAAEKHQQMAGMLSMYDQFTGKWVSQEYVYKEVMRLTDDEIAEIQKQIENERGTKLERDMRITQNEYDMLSLADQVRQLIPQEEPEKPEEPEEPPKAPVAPGQEDNQ